MPDFIVRPAYPDSRRTKCEKLSICFLPPARGKWRSIKRRFYSWEQPVQKKRKRFYKRKLFWFPLLGLAVLAFVGWVAIGIFTYKYEKMAGQFDLSAVSQMESASVLYDRKGREFAKLFIQNRQTVPFDQICPMMPKAVIAAEDNKFYEHDGVDYMGILRAAISNYKKGRISQGASTVTQQLARNSFELKERTYERKLVELFLARRIEKNFSKEQIMGYYLNRVYFGSGFYGVESASRGYFGRAAKDMDIGQCAMLAGLLKSPQALSPFNNMVGATEVRNFVLKRMREQGFINKDQYKEAIDAPLLVIKRTNPFKLSYAVETIRLQAIALKELGFEKAMNGGFRIETTLDIDIQRVAERTTKEVLAQVEATPGYSHPTFEQYRAANKSTEDDINRGIMTARMPEPKYLQSASLVLENATGAIVALVGGRDFKHSEYNRVIQGRRPAGTAFTPFVYAAAFQKGIFPGEIVQDACIDNRYVMVGGETGILGEWGVESEENEYEGPMPLREALFKGKNAATVRLGMKVGLDALKATSKAAGIASPLRDYSNSFLGSSELTLDELTLAYSVFPNLGKRPEQIFLIKRIVEANGNVIYQAPIKTSEALSPAAAFQTHAALADFMEKGLGTIATKQFGLAPIPVAGKSGTAYNFTDDYFFGYSDKLTCGVWVGFDKPTKIFRGAFGKDTALPIWTKIMNAAAKDFPPKPIEKPDGLKAVPICRTSGLLATPRCKLETGDTAKGISATRSLVYTEYATESEVPKIRCDIHGGGVRNYAKEYDEAEWPRAAAAVDLSKVRPIAVEAPTLLGLNDAYQSVSPKIDAVQDDGIPVAKAIAVTPAGEPAPEGAPRAEIVKPEEGKPGGLPSPQKPVATPTPEPEVRKAEAVKPLDAPMDSPVLKLPPPPAASF